MPKSAVRRSDKPDLESVRRAVDWHSSKQKGICPLCHKRKLSISAGRDVEVVAKCWGGCNQAEVAAALGLSGGEPRTGAKLKRDPSDPRYDQYCRFRDGLAITARRASPTSPPCYLRDHCRTFTAASFSSRAGSGVQWLHHHSPMSQNPS
jgi:hypothetical protein